MKSRKRLDPDRASITSKVDVGGHELYITVGFYENQQPGEVFVKIAKQGSTMSGLVDGWAVLASMLLQTGWPWSDIARKMRHSRFEPNDNQYSSIYDAIVANVSRIISLMGGCEDKDYDWDANRLTEEEGCDGNGEPAEPEPTGPTTGIKSDITTCVINEPRFVAGESQADEADSG